MSGQIVLCEPLTRTISAVAVLLEQTREPWWIIAGAAAAIHGAQPMTSPMWTYCRAWMMQGTCSPASALRPPRHPRFRSALFGRWTATPLAIELMAGFRLRDRDGVWRVVRPETRQLMRVGSVNVFVPTLIELRGMFERLGRAKDLARVDLLDRIGQ